MNDKRLQSGGIGGVLDLSSGDDHVAAGDIRRHQETTTGHSKGAGEGQGAAGRVIKTQCVGRATDRGVRGHVHIIGGAVSIYRISSQRGDGRIRSRRRRTGPVGLGDGGITKSEDSVDVRSIGRRYAGGAKIDGSLAVASSDDVEIDGRRAGTADDGIGSCVDGDGGNGFCMTAATQADRASEAADQITLSADVAVYARDRDGTNATQRERGRVSQLTGVICPVIQGERPAPVLGGAGPSGAVGAGESQVAGAQLDDSSRARQGGSGVADIDRCAGINGKAEGGRRSHEAGQGRGAGSGTEPARCRGVGDGVSQRDPFADFETYAGSTIDRDGTGTEGVTRLDGERAAGDADATGESIGPRGRVDHPNANVDLGKRGGPATVGERRTENIVDDPGATKDERASPRTSHNHGPGIAPGHGGLIGAHQGTRGIDTGAGRAQPHGEEPVSGLAGQARPRQDTPVRTSRIGGEDEVGRRVRRSAQAACQASVRQLGDADTRVRRGGSGGSESGDTGVGVTCCSG